LELPPSTAHLRPPVFDGVDGEGGRITIDADIHPSRVLGDVRDAVKNRQPTSDCAARNTRDPRQSSDATKARRLRLRHHKTPKCPLVQHRNERLKA